MRSHFPAAIVLEDPQHGIIHMPGLFWFKRFLSALSPAFAILTLGQLVQSRGLDAALLHAAIWAPITAFAYVVALRFRRCNSCVDARPSA